MAVVVVVAVVESVAVAVAVVVVVAVAVAVVVVVAAVAVVVAVAVVEVVEAVEVGGGGSRLGSATTFTSAVGLRISLWRQRADQLGRRGYRRLAADQCCRRALQSSGLGNRFRKDLCSITFARNRFPRLH